MAKSTIKVLDIVCGQWVRFQMPAYTTDVLDSGNKGTYTVEEWSKARKQGYNDSNKSGGDLSQLSSDAAFFHHAMKEEFRKILSARRFVKAIEMDRCQSVLEVGAGEMLTSLVAKINYPHVRYVASDYDPYVIEKCRERQVLDGLEREVVDIKVATSDSLAQYDVVVAWEVFYAFSLDEMKQLFDKVYQADTKLVICSSQFVGPIGWSVFCLKNWLGGLRRRNYQQLEEMGKIRAHGVKYSLSCLKKQASLSGLRSDIISLPSKQDWAQGDVYTMVCYSR